MNKDELIELLKTHKYTTAKRDLKLNEIEKLKRDIQKIETNYNVKITSVYQEGSKSNEVSSKVENMIVKKDNKIIEIQEEINKIEEEVKELNYVLSQVNIRLGSLKRLEKEIITDYYINEMDYKTIGIETYWRIINQTRSERTVARKIDEITEKLLKL